MTSLPDALTKAEKEVADMLLQGFLPRKIAKEKFITLSSVRFHINNIFKKCEVHRRSEFMAKYLDQKHADFIMRLRNEMTVAEQRVYNLAITGISNKQIAYELFIVEKTVKWHLSNIYKMFQCTNRAELIEKHVEKQKAINSAIVNCIKEKNEKSANSILPMGYGGF